MFIPDGCDESIMATDACAASAIPRYSAPKFTFGDLTGDGMDDLYIGTQSGSASSLNHVASR